MCATRGGRSFHILEGAEAFHEFRRSPGCLRSRWIGSHGHKRILTVKNRMRALGGKLLLAGVSLFVGLAVLEIGARIVLWSRPPGKSGEQAVYTKFDPVL